MDTYSAGTYSDRNTGAACWSCAGLKTGTPGPACIYPDSHKIGVTAMPVTDSLVHAATDDGGGHCTVCGQNVRAIGLGKTVHPDGCVAARTPATLLAALALVADWQQRASELAPERSETHENTPEDEANDAIGDTMHDCADQLAAVLDGSDR